MITEFQTIDRRCRKIRGISKSNRISRGMYSWQRYVTFWFCQSRLTHRVVSACRFFIKFFPQWHYTLNFDITHFICFWFSVTYFNFASKKCIDTRIYCQKLQLQYYFQYYIIPIYWITHKSNIKNFNVKLNSCFNVKTTFNFSETSIHIK